ncbi:hypothetical protein AQUCO_00300200v1 [Aquilegia coerulea]|uniref:Uncharacterized protein n=1 Tax=Aquilegia coerulea TaxID=218851 RepID=A0A2G5EXT9_AQUCA|nr:hypothetical protein AQUCO_00300200v1 [Aquilegia coerulea]
MREKSGYEAWKGLSWGMELKTLLSSKKTVEAFLGKTFDDLLNLSLEFDGDRAMKETLQDIGGKKLKFEIRIGDFNLDHPEVVYCPNFLTSR